jgi:hypothetical protein
MQRVGPGFLFAVSVIPTEAEESRLDPSQPETDPLAVLLPSETLGLFLLRYRNPTPFEVRVSFLRCHPDRSGIIRAARTMSRSGGIAAQSRALTNLSSCPNFTPLPPKTKNLKLNTSYSPKNAA